MIHSLYQAASHLLGPAVSYYLNRRLSRGKEDADRFAERKGRAGRDRPVGKLVWLHGASVGEALSLLPLVDKLIAAEMKVLTTTGTVTSGRLMEQRLPEGAIHQYVPADVPGWVRRFLDHWRPDLVLWAESDFWPNLLAQTHARGIPMVLVQGRVSPRSLKGWKRAPGFIRTMLRRFDLCLGQTPGDAARLLELGAVHAVCAGNIKHSAPPLPCDPAELAKLQAEIAGRPVWLASSTHAGEEAAAMRVHAALAAEIPNLLTVIAPRHPQRGAEIMQECRTAGLAASLRSAGGAPDAAIYVADTMGELGLFYRLAPIVFMGKSLHAEGGQNPFEPARLGAAVLFGPRMSNFSDAAASMIAAGAAEQVADEAGLTNAIGRLLTDPQGLESHRRAAAAWAESEASALESVWAALLPYIEAPHARP